MHITLLLSDYYYYYYHLQILKSQVDCVELQQEFGKLQCRIIPSIEFSVYVYDEDAATDEIEKYLDIEGTTSNIFIKRQRE